MMMVCDEDGNPDRNGVGVLILGISVGSEVESYFMPKCCVIAALQSLFRHGHRHPRIKTSLTNTGFEAWCFSGHSFRRGAASSAAAVGFSDYEIQQLGRWRGDSYKLYLDGSQARILALSARLHWAVPHVQHPEPPSLLFPS